MHSLYTMGRRTLIALVFSLLLQTHHYMTPPYTP